VADYEWCVNTGTASVPQGFTGISTLCGSPTTGAATEKLTAANVTQTILPSASQNFPFTVELDDTGNAATPASAPTTMSATNSTAVLINAPLAVALTQTTNATPTTALLPGVFNRSYGVINAGAGAPLYTASYGLGGYTFPASPGPFSAVAGFACTNPTASTYTCAANTAISAAANTYSGLSLTVTDTANAAVPQGSAVASTSLMVNSQITMSVNLGLTWPDAVQGRAYGSGAGCTGGACIEPTYTIMHGLGVPYHNVSHTGFPANASFTFPNPTWTFDSTSITSAPGPYSPNFTATDTANEATPAATTVTDPGSSVTVSLNVDSPLGLSFSQNQPAPVANPANLLPGVTGRSYGLINGGGGTPIYMAAGGLGANNVATYEWCVDTGAASVPAGLTGITGVGASAANCGSYGPTGVGTATLSSSQITQSISGASQNFTIGVEIDDTGNATTPSSAASGTEAARSTGLLINAALAVGTGYTSNAFPDGVVGRNYGDATKTCGASACAPITYTASFGLPAYTFSPITNNDAAPAGTWPSNISCSAAATTYTCDATTGIGTGIATPPLAFTPSISVSDTGNYATPTGSLNSPGSLKVDAPLGLIVNLGSSPNYTWPDGVTGRGYGTNGLATALYTASNGLPTGYVFNPTLASFPTGFSCSSFSATEESCTASPITGGVGTYNPQVSVADTANATTPAGTTTTDPCSILPGSSCTPATTVSLTVDPEIVIQNQALAATVCGIGANPACPLPNGQKNQPYSVLFTCQAPLGTGTCGGTGNPNNAAGQYTWSTGSSDNITGTAITSTAVLNPTGDAFLFGTPTTAGSGETVTVSVTDNGNATTPTCSTAGTCPSANFTANVLNSYALVGANGSNTYAVFDTSAGAGSVTQVGSAVSPSGGSTPNYLATSTNGTYMFIADPGANQVYLHNTSTGVDTIVTNTSGLDNAAGDTAAVAVGPQAIPGSLISPDAVNVYVANAGSDNVQVIDGNPADSLTFGTVVGGPGTFLHGSYPGTGAVDLKVAPTFFVSSNRVTHGYVVRAGGNEVCVFDVEPTSGNFGKNIAPANSPNGDSCISLGATATYGTPTHIDISPDGLYAYVLQTDGATVAGLDVIDTNPNSATFEKLLGTINLTTAPPAVTLSPNPADGTTTTFTGTYTPTPIPPGSLQVVAGAVTGLDNGSGGITGTGIASGTINYATGAISVTFTTAPAAATLVQVSSTFVTSDPGGVRVQPDGQIVWVAGEDTGTLLGYETALVGTTQFSLAAGMSTPTPASDKPFDIAFRPDEAFGLATLSGSNEVLPFTTTAGTGVATTGVTTPAGIDHIANAALHIVTAALPAATNGAAYSSSIVANGPNKYFAFSDLTSGSNNLAGLGLALAADGQITSSNVTGATGNYTLTIQVTDQSLPVNNVVVKTVSLTIN
jgi:hypothetical protein